MTSTQKGSEILKTNRRGRVKTTPERRQELLEEFDKYGLSAPKYSALTGLKYQTFAGSLVQRRKQRDCHFAGENQPRSCGSKPATPEARDLAVHAFAVETLMLDFLRPHDGDRSQQAHDQENQPVQPESRFYRSSKAPEEFTNKRTKLDSWPQGRSRKPQPLAARYPHRRSLLPFPQIICPQTDRNLALTRNVLLAVLEVLEDSHCWSETRELLRCHYYFSIRKPRMAAQPTLFSASFETEAVPGGLPAR